MTKEKELEKARKAVMKELKTLAGLADRLEEPVNLNASKKFQMAVEKLFKTVETLQSAVTNLEDALTAALEEAEEGNNAA